MTERSRCQRLLVAAFDFGTAYSGYAFSFRGNPDKIETNTSWVAGSGQLLSLKCPTTVLLKPNREFHSFGYEAENNYAELTDDDSHHDWYLFRRFKMALYGTHALRPNKVIEDITGKTLPAIDVFAHSIRFLKEHLMSLIKMRIDVISESDIQFIITVPAIWDEKAKIFMRKAANKANIPTEQITFALEPEAASIWCQDDTRDKLTEPLTSYMVVDLGGGTADITVHRKTPGGTLKELHKASGGAWGGNEVDKAYLQLFTEIYGREAIENLVETDMTDYLDLIRDFETKKRALTGNIFRVRIPHALREFVELDCVRENIARTTYKDKIKCFEDKIIIDKDVIKALCEIPLKMLIRHIEELFTKPNLLDVNTILLVGGFGDSEIVKAAFQQSFPRKRLIVPAEASLAVLKGGVRFGHFPDIVSTRIARFTFGREAWPDFQAYHDPRKRVIMEGGKILCKNVFHKIVEKGEEIPYWTFHEEIVVAAKCTRRKQNHVVQFNEAELDVYYR